MRTSLIEYIEGKVHPAIRNGSWSRITVRGLHQRTGKALVSPTEKRDKRFNWQRPTVLPIDDSTLEVACFPGRDYVKHYATIIATYLLWNERESTIVEYIAPPNDVCMKAITDSNLSDMGKIDVVVIGDIHHFDRIAPGPWEGGNDAQGDIFAWQKTETRDGRKISFLGCMVSFWGDISSHLVLALQQLNGANCILYVGKAGSLRAEDHPNQIIATGECSYVDNVLISWTSALKDAIREAQTPTTVEGTQVTKSSAIVNGIHVTTSSPLDESSSWLTRWSNAADWVDCEVGRMAQACRTQNTRFGYLHIISDNAAQFYSENLSNERRDDIVQSRRKLFRYIEDVLESFLNLQSHVPGNKECVGIAE